MPGELGDELEQNLVGYYDRRYKPNDEWMTDTYGTPASLEHKKKKSVSNVLKSMVKKEDPDASTK